MNDFDPMIFHAPKNFKSGRLILGRYRIIDLIILVAGIVLSLLSIIIYVGVLQHNSPFMVLVMLLPAVICFILTFSTGGIYHNMATLLYIGFIYLKSTKTYQWEGVYKDDNEYTENILSKND